MPRRHQRHPQNPYYHCPREAGPLHDHRLEKIQGEGRQGGRRQKPRLRKKESPEEIVKWLAKATTKLNALNAANWTDDEKASLHKALLDFEESLNAILHSLEATGEAPEGTEEA